MHKTNTKTKDAIKSKPNSLNQQSPIKTTALIAKSEYDEFHNHICSKFPNFKFDSISLAIYCVMNKKTKPAFKKSFFKRIEDSGVEIENDQSLLENEFDKCVFYFYDGNFEEYQILKIERFLEDDIDFFENFFSEVKKIKFGFSKENLNFYSSKKTGEKEEEFSLRDTNYELSEGETDSGDDGSSISCCSIEETNSQDLNFESQSFKEKINNFFDFEKTEKKGEKTSQISQSEQESDENLKIDHVKVNLGPFLELEKKKKLKMRKEKNYDKQN